MKSECRVSPNFTAACVHVEDMGDYLLVGLADRKVETLDYLMFQRAHQFDEQDVRLGMDKVHVERNDQGYSGYGGIERVSLFPDHLHLRFDERGSSFMGMPTMSVFFDFDGQTLKTLRDGLAACFEGFQCHCDETEKSF